MKNIIKIALTSLALVMPASTRAADGPSFEETVEYLDSYLVSDFLVTYELRVTGAYEVKLIRYFRDSATLYWEFDFNAVDHDYTVDGHKIILKCKTHRCVSGGFLDRAYTGERHNEVTLEVWTENLSAAQKALDHIFNDLLPSDPFAD